MAATIKPIEAKSVHQIQSGQVIVDLCSVAKELVENALDADANAVEVRFKNYGLDSIEVQDNGTGISEANYETLALKHYTSKLSTYEDLSELNTFGFRGEALSSLCALSDFSVTTAQAHEAPKGQRLDFEISGKLKSTTLIAAQKGTTVTVENLFLKLPVRQKELSKNIKREYGKVLSLLQSYACISTNVKFTLKNAMPKGRSAVVFSTKGNTSTRDNVANVYGARVLSQLIELDLKLDFQSTMTQMHRGDVDSATVNVVGHISKPVFGEGRQTPDRQLFFVNGRPCGLPQIAKAINEIYKSYNVSQSPFIFADFRMDTNNYDVNVSPDKRTIFLHNAAALTERLKEELNKRFDESEQTVPQSQAPNKKLPSFKQLSVSRQASREDSESGLDTPLPIDQRASRLVTPSEGHEASQDLVEDKSDPESNEPKSLIKAHFGNVASTREEPFRRTQPDPEKAQKAVEKQAAKVAKAMEKHKRLQSDIDEYDDVRELPSREAPGDSSETEEPSPIPVRDFNARIEEQQRQTSRNVSEVSETSQSEAGSKLDRTLGQSGRIEEVGVVQNAFERMRPRRPSPEIATITIGDKVITQMIGTPKNTSGSRLTKASTPKSRSMSQFSQSLRKFDAAGGHASEEVELEEDVHEAASAKAATPDTETESTSNEPVVQAPTSLFDRKRARDTEVNLNRFLDTQQERIADHRHAGSDAADRSQEEFRVAELIKLAETTSHLNSKERAKRTKSALKSGSTRDSTADVLAITDLDILSLTQQASQYIGQVQAANLKAEETLSQKELMAESEEERLSLTISKSDFSKMHIAGQFNLGFIIALRHKDLSDKARQKDELFIIDQHASDEKYNFERLQAETIVGNQRLVHPVMLDLTAVEEEIVLENEEALQQNGFIIDTDTTGELPVGQRCKLLSLPLSKEVTFNTKDLEELIHLLSESRISADSAYVPRPGKVRKMFAMRACRSSIMIGKTLSMRQMRSVLDHMGRIDKPWNCPHGRPTMRHLTSLDGVDSQLWNEGDGLVTEGNDRLQRSDTDIWKQYAA